MNAFDWFNMSPEWHSFSARLSLTLLHSLWQGIAVVAVAAVALRWLRQSSANSRYIVAGLALLCLPIAAALTYWMVELPVELASFRTPGVPETHSAVVNDQLNASQPPIGDVSVANLPESTGPLMPTLQSDLAESANTITPGLPAEIPTASTCYHQSLVNANATVAFRFIPDRRLNHVGAIAVGCLGWVSFAISIETGH